MYEGQEQSAMVHRHPGEMAGAGMQVGGLRSVRPQELNRMPEDVPTYSQLITEEAKLGAFLNELVGRLEGIVARVTGHTLPSLPEPGNGHKDPAERELLEQHRRTNRVIGEKVEQLRHLVDVLGSRI
jgi:hypothetical protein